MLNCQTCKHRHEVVAIGHCTEFTEMPQIDHCGAYAADDHTLAKANGQVVSLSKPTGSYLHLPTGNEEVPQELRP